MTASHRRLHQINARLAAMASERRRLEAEAKSLENAVSLELGYRVPLRGAQLLDAMARWGERVA